MTRFRSAFTLVELLVVLSILGMLLGLFLSGRPDYPRMLRHTAYYGNLERCRELVDKRKVSSTAYPSALRAAAEAGHLDVCRYFVDELQTPVEKRHLFFAAASGNGELIQFFIDHGIAVDPMATLGDTTLLVYACRGGNYDFCKRLIDDGADVNACNTDALNAAAIHGQTEIFRLLIEHGATIRIEGPVYLDMTLLHCAAQGGSAEICQYLIDRGADVRAVAWNEKMTPLHRAAGCGHSEACRALIDAGADLNAVAHRYDESFTPLDDAANRSTKGQVETIKVLVFAGATFDLKKRYLYGYGTLPAVAVAGGDLDLLDFFVANGADRKQRDQYTQDTLLHVAAREGQPEMCRELLKYGLDVNARNERNETPLIAAASANRLEACRMLVENGADPMIKSKKGNALKVARSRRPDPRGKTDNTELINYLETISKRR